jgi:hypothetical protein
MKRTLVVLLVAAAAAALPLSASPFASPARLPLRFEPNHGQTLPEVRFLSRAGVYTLMLTGTSAVMRTSDSIVRMKFAGASPAARIEGEDELPGRIHYFRSAGSHTNIPTFARVAYRAIYPGIDLLFYGNERQLEYDFVVTPGANPRAIRLSFDGIRAMRIDLDGNLVLTTASGDLLQKAPVAYQEVGGERRRVRARYRLLGRRSVEFALGRYDRSRPLVIDPVLVYATFLGGSGHELIQAIATDNLGNAYITGHTQSLDFPNPNSVPHAGTETFVTKIDPNGQTFLYTTFIAHSYAVAIAVDGSSRAHITGLALPAFQPTAGAFQTTFGGVVDVFVARLDSFGLLDWATLLGGEEEENGYGIGIDPGGNVSVTGLTSSKDFPIQSAFQTDYMDGDSDMFVSRLDPTGSTLLFSSFLGGTGFDHATGLAVDIQGSTYITGYTDSDVIPDGVTPSCKTVEAPYYDAFVAKVSPLGTLLYTQCIGGTGFERANAIAVDGKFHAYVTGKTSSADFPLVNPIQSVKEGEWFHFDAFVLKLNQAGSALMYSTFIGGYLDDYGSGIAVDHDGFAYVAGGTYSRDFPVKDTLQPFGGEPWSDAFLLKITPQGTNLVYSTFLGGEDEEENPFWGTEWAAFVAVDDSYVAYVAGNTKSEKLLAPPALPNPAQPSNASPGTFDGWVVRVH